MPNSLYRLCALSVAVGDALDDALEKVVRLGGAAPAALMSIDQEPGLTVDELASTVGITGSGAVRLVDRLQVNGWVERRAGADGRTRRLHLTAAGRRLARQAFSARNSELDRLLEPLGADDRDTLSRLVDLILGHAVDQPDVADRTCRLCDLGDCPEDSCPLAGVHAVRGPAHHPPEDTPAAP